MNSDKNPFRPGDLVKYRDKMPSDFDPGGRGSTSYGDIGIVCEAPVQWDINDSSKLGVVYINSKNHLILAHKKDLIKVSQD